MANSISPLRSSITTACRPPEGPLVESLVAQYRPPDAEAVAARARKLVEGMRSQQYRELGVNHLMHEFSLSSQEGVALLCLAEALLRIPDPATANALIRDKIGHGDWTAHLGHSHSLFVNAAAWGLALTGKLLAPAGPQTLAPLLSELVARGGEPLVRRGMELAMGLLGRQFVMGETMAQAMERSRVRQARGYRHSFDMLGEAALTAADAKRYFDDYQAAIGALGRNPGHGGIYAGPGISIKLSALHPRYCRSQKERVLAELLPRLKALMLQAREARVGVNVDAEESERLELSLDLLEALATDPDLAGWNGLGFVVQSYQKRSLALSDYLIDLARRSGHRLMLRLVKGAYWDSEIKRAQVDGLADYPVFTRKSHTDLAYLVCAQRLLAAPDAIYPQFATHNARTVAAIAEMAGTLGVADYEFQCLHGMGESLYDQAAKAPDFAPCRIYAPVGSHRTLLPYLVRRLLENGANNSFINQMADPAVAIDQLLQDPLEQIKTAGARPHPAIPRPPELYGPRINSRGLDLSSDAVLTELEAGLGALDGRRWQAGPLIAGYTPPPRPGRRLYNPAKRHDLVGEVMEATPAEASLALENAVAAAPGWGRTSPKARADMLERAADLLQEHTAELLSLAQREAGKTWPDALSELREAVDFCRYYAAQARQLDPEPPAPAGPLVCISPWNFPLAIFLGQISAALAAGHPVLAKPAGQTPLLGALAVSLLHQAGIPVGALQFLPGSGSALGAILCASPAVRGVLFTGSTGVARVIARQLADRPATSGEDPLLIAETGGQNAMIVDTSALVEQVVQDVLVSGFNSAGQRCSALRLLCLQEECAAPVLARLKAAMAELALGDPRHLATDIGPVIDAEARGGLQAHVATLAAAGLPVFQMDLPESCHTGSFFPPTLIEIDTLERLQREVFGPVVHVLRYRAGETPGLIEAINATGYGLTFGFHSRIDAAARAATAGIRAGNAYINRNMVGAVVGVQPFGGEGLSGTGPKAGGPLYLRRLAGSENVAPSALGLALPSPAPALARLQDWARGWDPALAAACADYGDLSLHGSRLELPGPTGEANHLHFCPRGPILCLGPDPTSLLHQIAATLACGNGALVPDEAELRPLLSRLPEEVTRHISLSQEEGPGPAVAVLCAAPELAALWRRQLAAHPGPLVPVIGPGKTSGRYPLYRLLVERVVSINTAAAGGNAALMTLER